jgi:hypothetical protein
MAMVLGGTATQAFIGLIADGHLTTADQFRSRRWPVQSADSHRYTGRPHSRQWSSRQAWTVRRNGGEAGATAHTSVPFAIGAAIFCTPTDLEKGVPGQQPGSQVGNKGEETDDALMRLQWVIREWGGTPPAIIVRLGSKPSYAACFADPAMP